MYRLKCEKMKLYGTVKLAFWSVNQLQMMYLKATTYLDVRTKLKNADSIASIKIVRKVLLFRITKQDGKQRAI